jgi:hypothetical protein
LAPVKGDKVEPKAANRAGAVAEDENGGVIEEVVEGATVTAATEIEEGRSLALTGIEMLPLRLDEARRVDAEQLGARKGECPGRDRASDDSREVQYARAC